MWFTRIVIPLFASLSSLLRKPLVTLAGGTETRRYDTPLSLTK
jgi:hypothetical protein